MNHRRWNYLQVRMDDFYDCWIAKLKFLGWWVKRKPNRKKKRWWLPGKECVSGLERLNDINTLIRYAFHTTKKRYVFDVVSGTRKEFQTLPFSVCT